MPGRVAQEGLKSKSPPGKGFRGGYKGIFQLDLLQKGLNSILGY